MNASGISTRLLSSSCICMFIFTLSYFNVGNLFNRKGYSIPNANDARVTAIQYVERSAELWVGTASGHVILISAATYTPKHLLHRHNAHIRCILTFGKFSPLHPWSWWSIMEVDRRSLKLINFMEVDGVWCKLMEFDAILWSLVEFDAIWLKLMKFDWSW